MTYLSDITLGAIAQRYTDGFGRLRTSEPYTIFDSKQLSDTLPLVWSDVEKSGGGTATTYNTNKASTSISVSNLTAGRRVRQTFRRFNYQPGKSHLVFMTSVAGAIPLGIRKAKGLYDEKNGVRFEILNGEPRFVIRSYTTGAAVDTIYPRVDWYDKMDSTGESGITMDFTKGQIFFFDLEWLALGSVRFGFVIDNVLYYVYTAHHANDLDVVYMSTPNLPVRYEIENDGTGPASSYECVCCTVISEGGAEDTGWPGSVPRGASTFAAANNANIQPIFAMRLKSNYLGSSVKLKNFSINPDQSCFYTWYIMLNPTISGAAWSWTGLTNYSIEYDITRTNVASLTGGTILASGTERETVNGGGQVDATLLKDIFLGADANDNPDVIAIGVQRHSGTNINFYGSFNFIDQR